MSNKGEYSCRFITKLAVFVLFVNAFRKTRGSSNYSYEFDVHHVDKCPLSAIEFATAAKRRNCTKGLRYLCTPDKHLSSLIEFCTDRKTGLFHTGNCLRLEDRGDLTHYNCEERFISGCPTEPYRDVEIYKFPACLDINVDFKCFVADKDCPKRMFTTTENLLNDFIDEDGRDAKEKNFTSEPVKIHLVIIPILIFLFLTIIIAGIVRHYKTRRKKIVKGTTHLDEDQLNEHLLHNIHQEQTHEKETLSSEIHILNEKEECETQIDETQKDKHLLDNTHKKDSLEKETVSSDIHILYEREECETLIHETQKDEIQINEKKLRKFLSEGELPIRHVRCIIVGCAGAGKTTLLKRLQDVSFEELKHTERTEMVDVHVNSFEVLERENTIQSVKKENELPTIIFPLDEFQNEDPKTSVRKYTDEPRGCESKFSEEKNDCEGVGLKGASALNEVTTDMQESAKAKQTETTSINDVENSEENESKEGGRTGEVNLTLHSQGKAVNKEREKSSGEADNDETKDDEKYAISIIMDAVKQLSNEKHLHPRITFLDFAGQNTYYAFHQIYFSKLTCYILVVDMTKRFEDKVLHTNEKGGSRFESWTYQDYYKFWLKSIDSFGDIQSRVIVVGTHADKTTDQDCQKFFKEFFALFDVRIHHDLYRHLHEDRKYAIGFPKTGSELVDLKDIKCCIAKIVQRPEYLEKIPPVWAIFEHILQREKKSQKIISRKKLSDYNMNLSEEFRMKDEEITKMLTFMHRVGTLLHLKEDSLKETIILDIQWFVDAFKAIINYPVAVEQATDNKRKTFQSTGELDDKELNEIWKNCPGGGTEYFDHKKEILSLMEHLGLLLKGYSEDSDNEASTWYYIPSMNKRVFHKDDKGFSKSSILCFKFRKQERLPLFVFYRIVFKCLRIPGWTILTEDDENQRCIYDYAACLCFRDHIVVICVCRFQIQVQVWLPGRGVIDSKLLNEIQQAIEDIIQGFKLLKNTYIVGYKCKNGVLNVEDDNSFIAKTEFPVSKLLCKICKVWNKHYVDNKMCWVQNKTQEIKETQPTFEVHEGTDEGLVSLNHILQACVDGNIEDFKFHLKREISPRNHLLMRQNADGWNVLHVAAKGGNKRIFLTLMSEKLDICRKTHDQMTVLHIASKYGHYEICEYILNGCKDVFNDYIFAISSQGKNACHYAAESGSVDVIRLLVKKKINAKAVTNKRENIFHIACIYSRLEMCEYIYNEFNELTLETCEDKWNATLHAAKNGDTKILQFLKEKNISLEHISATDRNALHIACDNGHLEASSYLMNSCPPLLLASDHKGRHAVHFAARSGNTKLLKHHEFEKHLTKETFTNMNILHMACLHDHVEMCRYILERYPDLNIKSTENNWTPAHFVAGRGNNKGNEIEIFEMLRKAQQPVKMMELTKKGNSVLTLAIKYNVFEFAEYLFENYPKLLAIQGVNNPSETGNENPKMLELLQKYLVK